MDVEFDVFIPGKTIDLVALNAKLAAESKWYSWFNDKDVTSMMQHHYFPNNPDLQVRFFKDNIEGNRDIIQLGIVHKKDNLLIGMISLSSMDFHNRKCEIAGLIGEKSHQTFSSYAEAFGLMLDHGFNQLNMRRIYGGTLIKELADILVRVFGFALEGVKRQDVFKNGRYHDVYLLGLLQEEYESTARKAPGTLIGTNIASGS
jgi:RimJ/RimL family protein N-acetyltransferase